MANNGGVSAPTRPKRNSNINAGNAKGGNGGNRHNRDKSPAGNTGGGGGKGKSGGGGRSREPYNPLAPMTPQELRRQAAETLASIYKPEFASLNSEEKRVKSISDKRHADNVYYLSWLDNQSKELAAHEDAASASLLGSAQAAQGEVTSQYADLHNQLVQEGEATPGNVSNAGDANAFDTSAEFARGLGTIAQARAASQAAVEQSANASGVGQAANFAEIAANEAVQRGELSGQVSKLGQARQELRLSKGAEQAKEYARLLDREIQKAQIRGQLKASSSQAAIEAARFGLDKEKLGLEGEEFNYEKFNKNRKFGLEGREQSWQEQYEKGKLEAEHAKGHKEKIKASHKITGVIQEGISVVGSHPKLQKLVTSGETEAAVRRLTKLLGSATAAQAAVELVGKGSLTSTTRADLREIGYIVPKKWR